ncbi:hypothetical protein AURDEDRAFT_117493, partial [Auricularia subglabra TFB-10046 SS5]
MQSLALETSRVRLSAACTHARRTLSTNTIASFYRNKLLERYSDKPTGRLSLRQLVFFGRAMNEERLIKARIRQFCTFSQIATPEENDAFCRFLHDLLNEHLPVILNLFFDQRVLIRRTYVEPEALDAFMRRMLVSRISPRVLVQHHIALSQSLAGRDDDGRNRVGIIYTTLNARESDMKSAIWPEVIVDGHLETRFSYIREHFEYMVFERLKNSTRFTRTHHTHDDVPPPIRVTIVAGSYEIHLLSDQGGGLLSSDIHQPFFHTHHPTRMESGRLQVLRAVSENGGISATIDEQVARWKKATERKSKEASQHWRQDIHPRIRLGLPMSNVFARYFGGEMVLVSWGVQLF